MTLRDAGLFLVRRNPWIDPLARWIFSRLPAALQDRMEARVAAYFKNESDVHVLQIGAFNGVNGDMVRPLLLANPGWRAVLVEPQPLAFEALRRNYAALNRNIAFVPAAVSDRAGSLPLYSLTEEFIRARSLPEWSREIASFDPAHLSKHFADAEMHSIDVPVITFAQAAENLPEARVDLAVIDVEGHEETILDSIDLARHGLRMLVFEHKHMTPEALDRIVTRLEAAGYRTKQYGRDCLAWRPPKG